METPSTRQRALEVALALFSRRGYDGVSLGDIAGELGIKPPSLYKHFPGGKGELYEALFPPLEAHYAELWKTAAQRQAQVERDAAAAGVMTLQQLEGETMAWLRREMDDPQAGAYRRLLAQEQFTRPDRPLRWLWEEPLALYDALFTRLVQEEVLRRGEPHVMAREYLAPLTQSLAWYDRAPERQEACLEDIQLHIRQFHRVFARREPKNPTPRLFRR